MVRDVCVLVAGLTIAASAQAADVFEFPLAIGSEFAAWPQTNGQLVLWNQSGRIYGQSLLTAERFVLPATGGYQSLGSLSGDIVTLTTDEGGNWNVYGYHLSTGELFSIATTGASEVNSSISGQTVVWQQNNDIYGKYLPSGLPFPICVGPATQQAPVIDGSIVAWHDWRDTSTGLYACDLATSTEFAVSTNAHTGSSRYHVDNGVIYWLESQGGQPCILAMDATTRQVSTVRAGVADYGFVVQGDMLIFHQYGSTCGVDIWARNMRTGEEFPVCEAPGTQYVTGICGNLVVWYDYRNAGNESDVYGAYIGEPCPLAAIWQCAAGSSGDWSKAENWLFGTPDTRLGALIDNGGYALVSTQGASARSLTIGQTNNGLLSHFGVFGGSLSVDEGVVLGNQEVAVGKAVISGGTMTAHCLVIGSAGTGGVSVQSGGTLHIEGDTTIGEQAGSVGLLAVGITTPSDFITEGALTVGMSGHGSLLIRRGGWVQSGTAIIAQNTSSIGDATVDGDGSLWTNAGLLEVGGAGIASLTVKNKGAVYTGSMLASPLSNETATVTVDGAGSLINSFGLVTIGDVTGTGNLLIQNGGSLTSFGGRVGAQGNVTVDGTGSSWTSNSYIVVGESGKATLKVINGGSVSGLTGSVGVNGTVVVSGATSRWRSSGALSLAGALTVGVGAEIEADSGFSILSTGKLNCGGRVIGDVVNHGAVNIQEESQVVGTMTLVGNYTQASSGNLQVYGGPDGSFGTLKISGNASLGGNLAIIYDQYPRPTLGQTFDILTATGITGSFTGATGTDVPNCPHRHFALVYGSNTVSLQVAQDPDTTTKLIDGIPQYTQKNTGGISDCGPTSVGMIMGYWDKNGYDQLVSGNPDDQTGNPAVQTMIDQIASRMVHIPGVDGYGALSMPLAMSGYWNDKTNTRPLVAWCGWDYRCNQQYMLDKIKLFVDSNPQLPLILYTKEHNNDHFVVVEGYTDVIDTNTNAVSLTSLYIVNPSGQRQVLSLTGNPNDGLTGRPIWDVLLFYPSGKLPMAMNVATGGRFDSSDDLNAFAVNAVNGNAEITSLPGTPSEQVLALTTDGGSVTLSQDMMLAAGKGFELSFDYLLPEDSKLQVLVDGNVIATLDVACSGLSHFSSFFDTGAMGLDPNSLHEMGLRFSAAADPTAYLDNMLVEIQPVPEPSPLVLLGIGVVCLLGYAWRWRKYGA